MASVGYCHMQCKRGMSYMLFYMLAATQLQLAFRVFIIPVLEI